MLGSIDPQRPVLIIGAGISGLSLGFKLKRLGLNYRIIESSHRTGGKLGTHLLPQGIAEQAANALLNSEPLQVLWRELKLEPLLPKKNPSTVGFYHLRVSGLVLGTCSSSWPKTY